MPRTPAAPARSVLTRERAPGGLSSSIPTSLQTAATFATGKTEQAGSISGPATFTALMLQAVSARIEELSRIIQQPLPIGPSEDTSIAWDPLLRVPARHTMGK